LSLINSIVISMERVAKYKLVLLGDGGVGKSTLLRRHRTGEFREEYIPTRGCNIVEVPIFTNHGRIDFEIWDTAGQETIGPLRQPFYLNADCAILMFDLSSRITYKNIPKWHRDLMKVVDVPVVLVGNKADLTNNKIRSNEVDFGRGEIPYFEISAYDNVNTEKPFLSLLRTLVGDPNLQLEQQPSDYLQEEQCSESEMQRVEREWENFEYQQNHH
jgi:GTP-binding nuclear protein Ran